MLELETAHGSFCYEYEFERAGFAVLRAIVDGREPPKVVSDGKDVTTLTVERAMDLLLRQGRQKRGKPEVPAHLLPPYPAKDMAKRIAQRAEWIARHDRVETRRRHEWRQLHQAAEYYLEQHRG